MGPKNSSAHAKCSVCECSFTRKSSFKRHVQKFHPCDKGELSKNNEDYECNKCDETYSSKNNLKQHERSVHNDKNSISNLPHQCVFCGFNDSQRYNIVKHYEENHHIKIEAEEFIFKGKVEFENWKKEMENYTSTFFRKTCTFSDPRNGFNRLRFFCNRSGHYKSKGKGVRKLRNQGSLKIGGICPAEIDVMVYDDGKHVVKYVISHCGHKNDFQDQYLTKSQKESLAIKIAAGVPYRVILDEARDTMKTNSKLEKAQFLSRKDLYNITKSFHLVNESRVPVDGLSIEEWAKEMSGRGTVIYYKLKGSFCNVRINLHKDDFVIIIMNESQREMLEKYSSNCICIDRTHCLNSDGMELISLLVSDDEGKGFPCSFFISNRIDTETISLFYSCIKTKIGKNIETSIFISDLENTFYYSWLDVMGTPNFRFFCPWHVENTWRNDLQKIKSRKLQALAYEELKLLLEEEDKEEFDCSLAEFSEKLLTKETEEFFFCFHKKFMNNSESWAQYYKTQNIICLSSDLATIHEDTSKLFVFGKNNNQLNLAVTALMNYVTNRLIQKKSRKDVDDSTLQMETDQRNVGLGTSNMCKEVDTRNVSKNQEKQLSVKKKQLLNEIAALIGSCTNEYELRVVNQLLVPIEITLKIMKRCSSKQIIITDLCEGEKIITEKCVPDISCKMSNE